MLTKEKIIDIVKTLPDSFTIDELIEKIIIFNKIEIGLKQVEEGKVLTTDEVKQRIENLKKR